MKALVAGGGIAGLATGIALRQAGFDVEIFERSAELREIGAGLMIWPNGTRSLHALGVEIAAGPVSQISFCSWRGRLLIDFPVPALVSRFGSEIAFIHRADLQAALVKRLGKNGLRLGADVRAFTGSADNVQVTLSDGSVVRGDFLVGADGLRSMVRRQLLRDGDPVYLGSTVWRGMVARDGIPFADGAGFNWVGRGSEFVAFHLADNRIYWAGVTKEPRGEKPGPGGHKQDVLQRFADWTQPVPALIAATEDAAVLRNDMYDRPPTRRWSGGRVTLVGDAAHPMTPNAGQGACQALEDAVALGDSFADASSVTDALASYERRRRRRANRVVAFSRQGTRSVQIENPILCGLRDNFSRLVPRWLLLRMLDANLAPSHNDSRRVVL